MIKSIAKMFEFNEASISRRKLRQIFVLMVVSLPVWPLMILAYYQLSPGGWLGNLSFATTLVGAICMFCFVCTRFVNRFFFPDKYLDEWEKTIKHRSMSFAFMVLIWIMSPAVIILMLYTNFNLNLSGEEVGLWAVGILLALLYLQTFHALWLVEPIDEDELAEPVVRSRAGLYIFAGVIVLFFAIPFTLGLISGFKNGSQLASLAKEAKSACEARGSSVNWVSTKKETYGFACFDENRELPKHLK